jgi:hypothetical protein
MNKASIRSILFLFAFTMLGFTTSAQKRSYTDYYFEAKTLVDSLRTYQILIQAHGETYPFISNEYVKNEVLKSFNFLNIKKTVDTIPDFVIKIIVSDVDADVDYGYKGKVGDNDTYQITLTYDVSFALSFEVNEKPVVFIPLCTKKHYEKSHNYSRQSSEYNPNIKDRLFYQIPKPGENKPVGQYVDEWKVFLNTKANFIMDFNEVLVKFRKKK